MHQSIPAVPTPPRATMGHLLKCLSRGWGISNFIAARGLGIDHPGATPGHLTHVLLNMEEFVGKDEDFVKDWLVRHGLEKLVVLKVCFLSFKYFFIYTCRHMNISDKVNYILFITTHAITDVNTART